MGDEDYQINLNDEKKRDIKILFEEMTTTNS